MVIFHSYVTVYQRVTIITWHPLKSKHTKQGLILFGNLTIYPSFSRKPCLPSPGAKVGGRAFFAAQRNANGSKYGHMAALGNTKGKLSGRFGDLLQSLDSYWNFRCFRPRHSKTCFWKRDL